MRYTLDLSRIPLAAYQPLLAGQNLLPGRRILLDGLNRNFEALSAQGIDTLAQLKQRLSAPQKLAALAAATGISEEYLTILKREIGSLEQKPVLLSAYPGLDEALLVSLREQGIVTSKDGFERGEVDSELFCLCDLARINGVGAVAARAFYEAGYRSVADIAAASAAEMLARVSAANAEHGYYQAKLGEKDMQFCIDFARLIERFS
jgi:hypothetical protein